MQVLRSASRGLRRQQSCWYTTKLQLPISRQPFWVASRFTHSTNMTAQKQWDELISFWFDRDPEQWFFPPEGFDDEIRTKYNDLIQQARSGALDDWAKEPRGVLSLVLLLDQFPRNIFRGSGDSFSSDNKALKIVTQAIAQDLDKELGKDSKLQQSVLYLPFMHAEDLLAQVAGQALCTNLAASCGEGEIGRDIIERQVPFGQRHLVCVDKLGRFPARNKALGRTNTKEEDQWLTDHPTGF